MDIKLAVMQKFWQQRSNLSGTLLRSQLLHWVQNRAHQRILGHVLHYGVQHLQQRIPCCALYVERIAADGHVENRPHRLVVVLYAFSPVLWNICRLSGSFCWDLGVKSATLVNYYILSVKEMAIHLQAIHLQAAQMFYRSQNITVWQETAQNIQNWIHALTIGLIG